MQRLYLYTSMVTCNYITILGEQHCLSPSVKFTWGMEGCVTMCVSVVDR